MKRVYTVQWNFQKVQEQSKRVFGDRHQEEGAVLWDLGMMAPSRMLEMFHILIWEMFIYGERHQILHLRFMQKYIYLCTLLCI